MARSKGFTLLELLVALFVAAVMFALGYAGLVQAAANRAAIRSAQQDFSQLQRTVRILAADLAELEARPVRDQLGRALRGAVEAGGVSGTLLSVTRGGRNPASTHARGSLQRVAYSLEDGALVRSVEATLDPVQGSVPLRRVLMRDVRALRLRFLDPRGEWRDSWPATDAPDAPDRAPLRARPRAIEFTLETDRFGSIRRVIEVPG